jgi:RND family efflux transporter MFP subunit
MPPYPRTPQRLPARLATSFVVLTLATSGAHAAMMTVAPTEITEWKAVYGTVETRDSVAARARIGGILTELLVTEGERVTAGQRLATVHDDKIALEVDALGAQIKALGAQLANAQEELARGQALVESGVATAQRLGQLSTQVDVFSSQIAALEAQREVLLEQALEGEVLAPSAGTVLSVPLTTGAVLMPGEPVVTVGSGGFFLRLAIPERYADLLEAGMTLAIETGTPAIEGKLTKVYPRIENGRVIADVEVAGLPETFVDRRMLVRVPMGSRSALMLPKTAVTNRSGLDFITVASGDAEMERSVVLGATDGDRVEVVSGLNAGEMVVLP